MSTVVKVEGKDFCKILNDLAHMFPKGSKELPIGVFVRDGSLTITCLNNLVYQASIPLVGEHNMDAQQSSTVLYYDISSLAKGSEILKLVFNPVSVEIVGADFISTLQQGYSTVEYQTFKDLRYQEITDQNYMSGLQTLVKAGIDKIYNKIAPIIIERDMSLIKYPNVWIQTRTTGLPMSGIMDIEHVQAMLKFDPKKVCTDEPGILTFKNKYATLQLPVKVNNSNELITTLMGDLDTVVPLNIHTYFDRVRLVAKNVSKSHCQLTIYERGLKTAVNEGNNAVAITTGDVTTKVISVVRFPMQLWLVFLKCMDSDNIELLVGGGKICLRTSHTIIVAPSLN